jgi:hypothetical protein
VIIVVLLALLVYHTVFGLHERTDVVVLHPDYLTTEEDLRPRAAEAQVRRLLPVSGLTEN